jgi:hypothetical protein
MTGRFAELYGRVIAVDVSEEMLRQGGGNVAGVGNVKWGVVVTLVELKDIQLPESMKRAMARQAEAEREKRAKIIAAEGEALAADQLGVASDVMLAHPLALQLRTLQTLVEIGVDKNTMVVVPAPLVSTIQELGAFLAKETAAVTTSDGAARHNGEPADGGRRAPAARQGGRSLPV